MMVGVESAVSFVQPVVRLKAESLGEEGRQMDHAWEMEDRS